MEDLQILFISLSVQLLFLFGLSGTVLHPSLATLLIEINKVFKMIKICCSRDVEKSIPTDNIPKSQMSKKIECFTLKIWILMGKSLSYRI